jgi:transposase-like protein
MPFRVPQHLRMEHGGCYFLGCHLGRVFRLFLLRHGDLMKEIRSAVDLLSVISRYGTDDQCREYIAQLRWPDGVKCPECKSDKISYVKARHVYDCDSCRYQFSALVGTSFHDTHLPLTKWFYATYIMCESRKGVSANQLKRMLRVSYKTAWYLCHRIRHAMVEAQPMPKLGGTVEIDETYVGGKKIGYGVYAGKKAKEVVIGIRQRGGTLRFFHAEDAKSGTLARYIRENIDTDVEVMVTDEFSAYPDAMRRTGMLAKHKTIQHKRRHYVNGDIHTNTVESAFSLLKRGIIGSWHRVSAKHLAAYLDEMTWRFNNRKNPFLFRDTVLKLITSGNLEYKNLTKAA